MAQIRMKYGIDLGTTNSAICYMENGEPVVRKTDTQKDTFPSCFAITKRTYIGDKAYNLLRSDRSKATKDWTKKSNVSIEFKRTMGIDTRYHFEMANRDLSSEELSAEVLKALKSFVTEEDITSAVITVPAKFTANQKSATTRAAALAGITHCVLLQEPVAAALAYGLKPDSGNGNWLVFDFGGGTFDAALLKVEDGIIQVKDTEGDNYLGGKNLDYAVVDGIIIPYLEGNFSVSGILGDKSKKEILRDAMKYYAEQAKNELSFKNTTDIISEIDEFGCDDDGTPIELDLTVTSEDLKAVVTPIFQKAVDIVKDLLARNNVKGSSLDALILVGGPTFSPVLRDMLRTQITPNVRTDIDPMTAVAKGAAIYASTVETQVDIAKSSTTDQIVALELKYQATSVESSEFVSFHLLPKECKGAVPQNAMIEFQRADGAWSSGKLELNEVGDVVECQLREGLSNSFKILVYDERGKSLNCMPNEITIVQGIAIGNAVLPYNYGFEATDTRRRRNVFVPFAGLEQNKQMPAVGTRKGLSVPHDIKPGCDTDKLTIPIYQGKIGGEGHSTIYNFLVENVVINGDDIMGLVPANSKVDITLSIDNSERLKLTVTFLATGETVEQDIDVHTKKAATTQEILNRRKEVNSRLASLSSNSAIPQNELADARKHLDYVNHNFEAETVNDGDKEHLMEELRAAMRSIEKVEDDHEWDAIDAELRSEFQRLEMANNELGNKYDNAVNQVRELVEAARKSHDVETGRDALDEVRSLFVSVTYIYQLVGFVEHYSANFNSVKWHDPAKARQLLNKAQQIVNNGPTVDELRPVVFAIFDLMPGNDRPTL